MKNIHILIVDDTELNRSITGTMLEDWTKLNETVILHVEEAVNGIEAIERYKNNLEIEKSFQIILMDYFMPYKNGFETAKEIREIHWAHAKKPVTILGYSEEYFVKMACPTAEDTVGLSYFDDFLHKLPTEMALFMKIENCISTQKRN